MNLLDAILLLPLVGFILTLLLPKDNEENIRRFTLIYSLVVFLVSLGLIGPVLAAPSSYSFVTDTQWIANPSIRYHIGLDGLSLWLVILSTLLTPLAVLISWNYITERVKMYYALLLLLEFGVIGVFVSLDLFVYYVFWEVGLVPMYFLIGIWGHDRRIYAAVKFFLYTMAGSVLMLAAIIYLYLKAGTFDYTVILSQMASGQLRLTPAESLPLFLAFFFAFAIKVPLFPLHTWLPDAHVEAPTAGSVMLASVMLKLGTYGLVRYCLPLFPNAARECAPWIVGLALVGIVYGALVALVQPNMKKLVAYSSVSHLGFVVLGIFAFNQHGLDGAVYQMLNHGVSTGALFMLVGMMYERKHSLEIKDYGGVAAQAPHISTLFLITTLASIGLPLLNNFVGEFLVLQGAAEANIGWAVFAALGVILSACYMLWLYQRVFLGRPAGMAAPAGHGHGHDDHAHDDHAHDSHGHAAHGHDAHGHGLPDLNMREWVTLTPLVILMVWMGVYAQSFLPAISASNAKTLEQTKVNAEFRVAAPASAVAHAAKPAPEENANAR